MKKLISPVLVCLLVIVGQLTACGDPVQPCEVDNAKPTVGLTLFLGDRRIDIGPGGADAWSMGVDGQVYSFVAAANDACGVARLQVHIEGGKAQDGAVTDSSGDKLAPVDSLLALGNLEPMKPGQNVTLWATAEDYHGNTETTVSVNIVTPGDYSVRVSSLQMLDREEGSGDEPYFILVGFRSRLGTPGSTTVIYNSYDRDWQDNTDDADLREVPESMGVISFPDVRRLRACLGLCPDSEGVFGYLTLGERQEATGYMMGERPEFLGVVMLVLEHDFTPSEEIQEMVNRIGATIKENVEELVEGSRRNSIERENTLPDILLRPGVYWQTGDESVEATLKRALQEAVDKQVQEITDEVESIVHDTFAAYPLRDDDDYIGSDFFTYVGLDAGAATSLELPVPALVGGSHEVVHRYSEGADYRVIIEEPVTPAEQGQGESGRAPGGQCDEQCCDELDGRCTICVPIDASCP